MFIIDYFEVYDEDGNLVFVDEEVVCDLLFMI